MSTDDKTNQQDIQQWMEEVADRKQPRKKLVFNKKTKRIEAVPVYDSRADDNINFEPEEARRFMQRGSSVLLSNGSPFLMFMR